jgi:tetratricopeptide (TPR) repeat protein
MEGAGQSRAPHLIKDEGICMPTISAPRPNRLYRRIRWAGFGRLHISHLLLLFILAPPAGCATQPHHQTVRLESCDPVADAAVESGELEKALAGHERLLAKTPGNCLTMYHLGFIWGRLGDRHKEVGFYEAAIKCGLMTNDGLYFNLGMAYGGLGDLDRAVQTFERAIAINPDHADNYFGLGLMQQAAGKPEQAEAAFLHAVSVDPEHRDARVALARLYLDQSRWDQAELQLEAVERIDPGAEDVRELRRLLESRRALQYER